jgi:hypothetical protein
MKSKIVIRIVISGINNGEIMASMAIISMAKYHNVSMKIIMAALCKINITQ